MPTRRQLLTAWITRRYPFLSGCGTFANSRMVRSLSGTQRGLAWGRLRDGSEILVPLDDYVGRAVFFVGDLDRKVSAVIARIVGPGDVVLDIGANLGLVTMQLAHLVGESGRVHAFEPNPAMVEILTQTLERNAARNVELHSYGLGSEDGQIELAIPIGHAGQASMTRSRWTDGAETVVVPVHTLTSVMRDRGIGSVRLMKIDVEGFEMEVLRGAEQWLASSPVEFILFESNDSLGDGAADPVISFLVELGYRIFAIERRLLSLSLSLHDPTIAAAASSHDFLAVHRSCKEPIESRIRVRSKS